MLKRNKIIYWIATIWLALGMTATGIVQILKQKTGQGGMDSILHLGYPVYLLTLLGICKLLGVIVVLIPKFPLLKEWAYAGFMFDLIGATYSFYASGFAVKDWIFMPVLIAVLTCSYIFYHKRLKLKQVP